jgi:hypothetical protein
MNTKIKTYKILVNSKPFANMRGASPAEVAKKAASKILSNSLNRTRFEIQKNSKIRHYDAKQENLVRPYHKNGKLVKYRIVVKKLGKQVGGTFPPDFSNLDDQIFIIFPREEYEIEIEDSPFIQINIKNKTQKCSTFFINDKVLYLGELNQCNDKSGTVNLNKIKEYGKYLKSINIIDKIELYDSSTIHGKKISLALLSILSTGMSWYNRFGFISKKFKQEQENNAKFLIMTFKNFLNECIPKILENKLKYYQEELNNEILELQQNLNKSLFKEKKLEQLSKKKSERNSLTLNDFKEIIRLELNSKRDEFISIFGNQNVKELFIIIKNRLKHKELSQEELYKIIELFEYIDSSGIIMYDGDLTLIYDF